MNSQPRSIASILFVCLGNICRSPAGEHVMRKLLEDAGLGEDVVCDSAGIMGYHIGASPDARMIAAGRRRGLPMTGIGRQVTRADLDTFDLVLAMDNANYAGLTRLANSSNRDKIKRFCDYCVNHRDTEVPDPYYGDAAGFEYVLDLLEDGCTQILREVQASRNL
jgi:protein-tyrosine phosphatase